MIRPRQIRKFMTAKRTVGALLGGAICMQLVLPSAADAAAPQARRSAPASERTVPARPTCFAAVKADKQQDKRLASNGAETQPGSESVCRLAMAVELSIQTNPGIF